MHACTKIAVLVAATLTASNAQAFWGVGDVTYDPSNYGQQTLVLSQLADTYKTMMDSYNTMRSMEATLKQTSDDYELIRNMNLKDSVKRFDFSGIEHRINYLTQDLGKVSDMTDLSGYQKLQMDNINDLKRLQLMQQATEENVSTAAGGTSKQSADVITAQSTATLASLRRRPPVTAAWRS